MSMLVKCFIAFAAIAAAGVAIGWVYEPNPEAAQYRQALVLKEEPTGSVTIEDARSQIDSQSEVVLTARIGTREMPQWWKQGTASFYVSEATDGSHYNVTPDHDPNTCAFCRHKWNVEDSMAIVHLINDAGEPIPIEAPELLEIQDGDVIVVQGTASLDDSGFLVVRSNGVFLKD